VLRWLIRRLAAREVERVRSEYEWVRARVAMRRKEIDLALQMASTLEREVYVMLVNELMWLAQLEHRWMHGDDEPSD
jgi:hypothetical protein